MSIRRRRRKSYKSDYSKRPKYKRTSTSVDRSVVQWTFRGEIFDNIDNAPKGAFGFIYKITDHNGKIYFGKKQIISQKNKVIAKSTYDKLKSEDPNRKDLKRTKNKAKSKKGKGGTVWNYKRYDESENDWKEYTGSCIPLNEAIDKGIGYDKEILVFCYEKKQLSYFENKVLYCNEVLENPDKFYNDCVSGKYYSADLINN